MMEKIVDEVSILDYVVASEFTEGQKNCKTSLIKMMADADSKALACAVEGGSRSSIGSGWFRRMRFRIRCRRASICIRFTSG